MIQTFKNIKGSQETFGKKIASFPLSSATIWKLWTWIGLRDKNRKCFLCNRTWKRLPKNGLITPADVCSMNLYLKLRDEPQTKGFHHQPRRQRTSVTLVQQKRKTKKTLLDKNRHHQPHPHTKAAFITEAKNFLGKIGQYFPLFWSRNHPNILDEDGSNFSDWPSASVWKIFKNSQKPLTKNGTHSAGFATQNLKTLFATGWEKMDSMFINKHRRIALPPKTLGMNNFAFFKPKHEKPTAIKKIGQHFALLDP